MAYSEDLRKKVIEYLANEHTQRKAMKTFGISFFTINKWSQKYRQTGELKDKKPCCKFKNLTPKSSETIL